MTLKEIIEVRKNRNKEYEQASKAEFWQGYEVGWKDAYQDLQEILEQNGFDMNIEVLKENQK